MIEEEIGLGTLMRRAIAALDGGAQQVYDRRKTDFRPRYFPIARHLLNHGPIGVSDLSKALGMTQPAVSQTLREMEQGGLVTFTNAEDRRVRMAAFSKKGLNVCRQLSPVWAAAEHSAEELCAEIEANLPDLLRRLLCALEEKTFAARIEEKLT